MLNQQYLQAMVDGMTAQWQKERAEIQMTLGSLLKTLEELPDQTKKIKGIGQPHSYRGYYSDLAFEPTEDEVPVYALVELLSTNCMGRTFEGYKGGDFVMGERTPLWISGYGVKSGQRLMELDTTGDVIVPITKDEDA